MTKEEKIKEALCGVVKKEFNEWLRFLEQERKENIKYDWNIYCQYGLSVGSGTMGTFLEVLQNKTKKEVEQIMQSDDKYLYCVYERFNT